MTDLTQSFPHERNDCTGDLIMGMTGVWAGDHYYDEWRCDECGVVAFEIFESSGFEFGYVEEDDDR